jgi:hypothetical protein
MTEANKIRAFSDRPHASSFANNVRSFAAQFARSSPHSRLFCELTWPKTLWNGSIPSQPLQKPFKRLCEAIIQTSAKQWFGWGLSAGASSRTTYNLLGKSLANLRVMATLIRRFGQFRKALDAAVVARYINMKRRSFERACKVVSQQRWTHPEALPGW